MAAGEGFEPSHTESESAVLPLHNPAKRKSYYNEDFRFVKTENSFFQLRKQEARTCGRLVASEPPTAIGSELT